jgi:hypothetical protein
MLQETASERFHFWRKGVRYAVLDWLFVVLPAEYRGAGAMWVGIRTHRIMRTSGLTRGRTSHTEGSPS